MHRVWGIRLRPECNVIGLLLVVVVVVAAYLDYISSALTRSKFLQRHLSNLGNFDNSQQHMTTPKTIISTAPPSVRFAYLINITIQSTPLTVLKL